MAEEAQYTSGGDSSTVKRKYDDSVAPYPPSSVRRITGFSAPSVPSQSLDSAPSYNSVPPPVDEIQLAKQRAQEIAARLVNNAEAKRPKFENGSAGGGFDSNDSWGFISGSADFGQKPMLSTTSIPSYDYGNPSKKIEIPNGRVGVIIGKGGETIKYLQLQSGAKIQVTRDMDADPHSLTREVELTGSAESIAKAEQLIKDVLAEAESGGSGRVTGQPGGVERFVMKVPNNKVGLVIGKGGDTIKNMQASTGARIQVIPLHLPPGDTSTERTVQIDGSSDQIEAAKQLVNEVIVGENRLRNPMAGGYSQQGYQAPPSASWVPLGSQVPPQGYGYMQPGPYPGQPYGAGWNQSAAGGGYDYYNQQVPQTAAPGGTVGPTNTLAHGYSQQTQTYAQDGYGGGYTSVPQSGYVQPQPGYNAASQTANGQTGLYGRQADNASQAPPPASLAQSGYGHQLSPNPSYPKGSAAQPYSGYGGYGAQKPAMIQPAYGQHPPTAAAQGGYAPPAPYGGYAQSDGGGQHPPSYGVSDYSQGPYGAPPSYGGQQPPVYGGSYGGAGGYPQQPPVYSGDAPTGGMVPKDSPQLG